MFGNVTPLKKHPGHPGWLALAVLGATAGVVWLDVRHKPASHGVETTYSIAPKAPVSTDPLPGASASLPVTPMTVATVVPRPAPAQERFITAHGYLALDPTKSEHIYAPIDGMFTPSRSRWLDKPVRLGEVLGTIYSKDVYVATQELLDTLAKFESQTAVDAARYKLMRWGMPMQVISRIEASGKPTGALPVVARVPGRVIKEPLQFWPLVSEGRTELYTISEPGTYVVYIEVPDADASRVALGMPVELAIDGLGRPLASKVAYVWKRSDHGKRTVRFDVSIPRVKLVENAQVAAYFDFGP
jgi:hypothetical protein